MKIKIIVLAAIALWTTSCKKQNDWLDVKSRKAEVVPTSLKDFRAMLNNTAIINEFNSALGILSADNLIVNDQSWAATPTAQLRNAYIWAKDFYNGEASVHWSRDYYRVFYANIVLDGLTHIVQTTANQVEFDRVKGTALFYRSLAFYNLAQIYAEPYVFSKPTSALGVPLRKTSDVNAIVKQSKLNETYTLIIQDLVSAEKLVGSTVEIKTHVSKLAVKSLLARVYLSIQDYESAKLYSESVIAESEGLLDFNSLNAAIPFPIPGLLLNKEMLFYSIIGSTSMVINSRVEPALYKLYANDDLRRNIFYKDNGATGVSFRGQYTGLAFMYFAGLATNEQYLIAAECNIRNGQVQKGLQHLNALLLNRWKKGAFVPLLAANSEEALKLVLEERRKELPFTAATRWDDLKRLNLEPSTSTVLRRFLNGENFVLMPNDKRYVIPIPLEEIRLGGLIPTER